MNLRKGELLLIAFNLAYLVPFTWHYVATRNFEFLWYVAVVLFFFALIAATLRKSNFNYVVLWGLSLWGLLHMAGGGIVLDGQVLYAQQLVHLFGSGESFVLKYDQAVHFFGFAVATLVVYHLLRPYLNERTNWKVVYPILVAAGAGLGVLNEIVEFIAVVAVSETGVGGYANTALDLIFNTLGATAAVVFIHLRRMQHSERSRMSAAEARITN